MVPCTVKCRDRRSRWRSCNLLTAHLAEWLGYFTCYCINNGGGTDTKIRVHTESWPQRRQFSCCFCWDSKSNPYPFDHKSGALTIQLSPIPCMYVIACPRVCVVCLIFSSYYWSREKLNKSLNVLKISLDQLIFGTGMHLVAKDVTCVFPGSHGTC